MPIKAAPGIYLIREIKETSLVNTGATKDRRIIKGEILDVGEPRQHDSGGELKMTLKRGTTVWFLNYSEDYDWFKEDNEKYYVVIGNDVRAYQE